MKKVAMIVRKPPYGDINAAEAVRHALGGVSGDLEVSLIMVDGGVWLARKGQDDSGTGLTNLEWALRDCKDMGVDIFADALSLAERGLVRGDLVEGVEAVTGAAIASILKEADATMIF